MYYGTVNQLKYEFVVQPGADSSQIRLAYRAEVGALVTLDPTTGNFSAWGLLQPGVNTLPIIAADLAGNTMAVIYLSHRLYLPLVLRNP